MLATAFLSMWISNTATAMMMVPILLSIIKKLEEHVEKGSIRRYSTGLLLGVAYSASIGGIATLVGTPPNLSFARIYQIMFPGAPEVSFSDWFLFAMPITIVGFIGTWAYLYFMFRPKGPWLDKEAVVFRDQYRALGPPGFEEKVILVDFILLATLWLTRAGISFGDFSIPGWSALFSHPEYLNDGTVAIAMAIVLFIIPSRDAGKGRIMDWKSTKRLPWNIVLLFGGGFALANGFKVSGLSMWFGTQLAGVSVLPPILIILIISLGMTFLTELTSNTATTEMLLPVLAGLSVSVGVHPLMFMLPATVSASMAFMLPVATPPNAVIFGSKRITVMQMARAGLWLNLFGAVLITLLTYYWSTVVFGYSPFEMPLWVK